MDTTLRDAAGLLGIKVDYDPVTGGVTVGGQTFANGSVPGATFDPATNRNYITDPLVFKSTFGPQTMSAPIQPITAPQFTAATPKTVSTSPMKSQVNQYMQSPIQMPEYTPTDLSGLQQWITQYQQQYGQGPFNQQGLMEIIQGIQGMQAPDMRYQTPEQIQQLQQVWQQAMQPNMDAQQQLMQQAYQQALGQITNQRASQGLLGGPETQRMMADQAGNYGLQSGALQAQTALDALMQAFNYAQLGLQEQGQNFNQNLSAQQAAMSGYGSGLGMQQEGAGNAVNMLSNMLGMQEGQNQYGTNLGVQGEQMRQNQQQFALGQLANILGMDIGQNQWSQDYSAQSMRDQYNQWAGTQGLNMQQAGLTGQYQGAPTLGQKQFDLTRDLGIAGMTGQLYGQDTMDMQKLIAQTLGQFQGQNTMDYNSMMAGLSGMNPYTGQQTWDAMNADRQYGLQQQQLSLQQQRMAMEQKLAEVGFDREASLGVVQGIQAAFDEMTNKSPKEKQAIIDREIREVGMLKESGYLTDPQATMLINMVNTHLGSVDTSPQGFWQRLFGGTSSSNDPSPLPSTSNPGLTELAPSTKASQATQAYYANPSVYGGLPTAQQQPIGGPYLLNQLWDQLMQQSYYNGGSRWDQFNLPTQPTPR